MADRPAAFVLRRTVREFVDDRGTDMAASLTYYAVLSVFPGLIALFSLVGLVGDRQRSVERVMTVVDRLVSSQQTRDVVHGALTTLAGSRGAGLGLALGLAGALFSASAYVAAFARAMNRILEVEEGRPLWRLRPTQVLVTVVALVLCALSLVILVVSGPVTVALGRQLGVGGDVQQVWDVAKWPVLAAVVMVLVALLYWATPNAKLPFRVISAGAFVAILTWLLASIGFGFYVVNFGSYNRTYGSVAGVVVALLWLWLTNLALVFGAELDSELERGRQLRQGIEAEEQLRLPPRETSAAVKARAARQALVARDRELRLDA